MASCWRALAPALWWPEDVCASAQVGNGWESSQSLLVLLPFYLCKTFQFGAICFLGWQGAFLVDCDYIAPSAGADFSGCNRFLGWLHVKDQWFTNYHGVFGSFEPYGRSPAHWIMDLSLSYERCGWIRSWHTSWIEVGERSLMAMASFSMKTVHFQQSRLNLSLTPVWEILKAQYR